MLAQRCSTSFVLLLLLLTTLVACSEDDRTAAVDPEVQFIINVVPDSIAPQWKLVRPDGVERSGRGPALVDGGVAGEYWLLWEPVPGWDPPVENPQRYVREPGESSELVGHYRQLAEGIGTVHIEAGEPGTGVLWNLAGPDQFFAAGRGSRVLRGRSAGEYRLFWQADSASASNREASELLPVDGSLVFRVVEDPATEVGTIVVAPEPRWLAPPWTLESSKGTVRTGRGNTVLKGVDAGHWTMTWGEAEGFESPAPSQVFLSPDATLYWPGEFELEPGAVAICVIDAEPDALNAPWVMESSDGIRLTGKGDAVMNYMPPGIWTLRWQPVPGYTTPWSLRAVLQVGQTLRWPGNYVPSATAAGVIVIDPEPDVIDAPWQMVSQYGEVFTGRGDSTFVEMPIGQYTLTWGSVPGYETPSPNPVVQVLAEGTVARFTVN